MQIVDIGHYCLYNLHHLLSTECASTQGRRNGFGIGGGGAKQFFYITLTYKRDTFFFISISVISKFTDLSVYFILIHIHLFISHYFQTLNFFGWQNIGGGGGQLPPLPPPPVPTAMLQESVLWVYDGLCTMLC